MRLGKERIDKKVKKLNKCLNIEVNTVFNIEIGQNIDVEVIKNIMK